MKEFFDINSEIVTFQTAEECLEKLNYLERNPDVLESIRINGQKRTLKEHTTKNRVDKIAEIIKDYYYGNYKTQKLILKKNRLVANYDLDEHPISFDFIFFLQAVHIKRKELNADEVIVNINWPSSISDIPGMNYESAKIFSGKIESRIKNILLDVASLFPFVSIVNNTKNLISIMSDDSKNTHIFPINKVHHNEYYRIVNRNPEKLFRINATDNSIKYVDEYIDKFRHKKIITLTLRSYALDTSRNNNIDEWVKFLRKLNLDDYKIIIIPDTDNIYYKDQTDLRIYDSFEPAAFSFDIRLAIYEKAYLNFFINNGPCVAASLDSKVNFLMFKILTPIVPHCTEEFLEDAGYVPYQNPRYLGKFQKYIWTDDTCEEITQEFEEFNFNMKA